jgi:hypothetical protein
MMTQGSWQAGLPNSGTRLGTSVKAHKLYASPLRANAALSDVECVCDH